MVSDTSRPVVASSSAPPLQTSMTNPKVRDSFRFVECSEVDGTPKPTDPGTIRSHVMRSYLRDHPRKKSTTTAQQDALTAKSARPRISANAAASVRRPTDRSYSINGMPELLRQLLDREGDGDDSSWHAHQETLKAALVQWRGVALPLPVSQSAGFRIQLKSVFGRLFDPSGVPGELITVDLGSLAYVPTVQNALSDAVDALCLMYIGYANRDRRWVLQAMMYYQRAIIRTQNVIVKAATRGPPSELILVVYALWLYEAVSSAGVFQSGWVGHARALLTLDYAPPSPGQAAFYSVFEKLTEESIYVGTAFLMGIVIRQAVAGYYLEQLEKYCAPQEVPLVKAITRVPEILERLDCSTSQVWQAGSLSDDILQAMALWTEIELEFLNWRQDDPARVPSFTDLQSMPNFFHAMRKLPSRKLQRVYNFSNTEVANIHRVAWMALFVLGCNIVSSIPSPTSPSSSDNSQDGPAFLASDLTDVQSVRQHTQLRTNNYAVDLCRTFPYIIQHMRGYGPFLCSGPIVQLQQYYQHQPETTTGPGQEILDFCTEVQETMLPGSAIRRMLYLT